MVTRTKRVKQMPVTRESFVSHFVEGNAFRVTSGLPKDAQIVESKLDTDRGMYVFIIQSEEFEPVKEGDTIPKIVPRFEAVEEE